MADGLLLTRDMRVRFTRPPKGVVDGMSLHFYRPGEAYDLSPELAEYLVAEGFASIEMRQRQRSSRSRSHDRRRQGSSLREWRL
jgi:hypothetical protein